MTTTDRPTAVHAAELLVAAVGVQLGLARLLAHAVEAATRTEDAALVPEQRAAEA